MGKDPLLVDFQPQDGRMALHTARAPGPVTMTFGEKIRSLRRDNKLSQRDLAGRVGLNFTYLSKIENGKLDFAGFPSEETILKLAEALDADAGRTAADGREDPERSAGG